MYAFVVGFNEWVLKSYIKDQKWLRSKSKNAKGWEVDGQLIREVKAPAALTGMSATNAKLYVVKPAKRGGYVADKLMVETVREAKKRGVTIIECTAATRDSRFENREYGH